MRNRKAYFNAGAQGVARNRVCNIAFNSEARWPSGENRGLNLNRCLVRIKSDLQSLMFILVCVISSVQIAQAQQLQFINSGFEEPTLPVAGGLPTVCASWLAGKIQMIQEDSVPGWSTTDPGEGGFPPNCIEIWTSGAGESGSPGPNSGNQFVEVNATSHDGRLSQIVSVVGGLTYRWSFAHRARDLVTPFNNSSTDVVDFEIIATAVDGSGGTVVGSVISPDFGTGDAGNIASHTYGVDFNLDFATTENAWATYSGTFLIPDDVTEVSVEFFSIVTAYGGSGGNFLDDVQFTALLDLGDAPTTYKTLFADNGPLHSLDKNFDNTIDVKIGASASDDLGGFQDDVIDDPTGASDDTSDDGVTFHAFSGSFGYAIRAVVTGTNMTGSTAMLCGYLDGAGDGSINGEFDNNIAYTPDQVGSNGSTPDITGINEELCIQIIDGNTVSLSGGTSRPADASCSVAGTNYTCSLTWNPDYTTSNRTYARFRVTTDPEFFSNASPSPIGAAIDGEVEDYAINFNPTAVTIGDVSLTSVSVAELVDDLAADRGVLFTLIKRSSTELAASLASASHETLLRELRDYLDSDSDGNVAILKWNTLEERGTIGFFVERRTADSKAWVRINSDLLPALIGSPLGAEYMLIDPHALPDTLHEYQIVELEASGSSKLYGPYFVAM